MKIEKKQWGESNGQVAWLYTITNDKIAVNITNYGCTVTAIGIKGEASSARNVILGYSTFDELLADKYYLGCIVGRYAGRISKASFNIDGTEYSLSPNDGDSGNHLHGGPEGLNKIFFTESSSECSDTTASIYFRATSDDMDQGYPGKVDLRFTISLNRDNEIIFDYLATPDRPTHINLTHHLYYNLGGSSVRPATEQLLSIDGDFVVETDQNYVPTGQIIPAPKEADFTVSRKIPGETDYNECFVLHKSDLDEIDATLSDPQSGLTMNLSTTCPGIIFYSGQFLDSPFYPKQGICLETQYFPDAPNQPRFPSTLFSTEKPFSETTRLAFKNIN